MTPLGFESIMCIGRVVVNVGRHDPQLSTRVKLDHSERALYCCVDYTRDGCNQKPSEKKMEIENQGPRLNEGRQNDDIDGHGRRLN